MVVQNKFHDEPLSIIITGNFIKQHGAKGHATTAGDEADRRHEGVRDWIASA
jgi:hypothetical protein